MSLAAGCLHPDIMQLSEGPAAGLAKFMSGCGRRLTCIDAQLMMVNFVVQRILFLKLGTEPRVLVGTVSTTRKRELDTKASCGRVSMLQCIFHLSHGGFVNNVFHARLLLS